MIPMQTWSCRKTSLQWRRFGLPCAKQKVSARSWIGEVFSIDAHFHQGPKGVVKPMAGVHPTPTAHDERLAIEHSTIRCKAFKLKGFSIRAFGTCARNRFADEVNAPPVMNTIRVS